MSCGSQSSWNGQQLHCTWCLSKPDCTICTATLGPMLRTVPTPASPGPSLYMMLTGSLCSVHPKPAGAATGSDMLGKGKEVHGPDPQGWMSLTPLP